MPKHNIHFVGSIGLDDSETVFRTLADKIGDQAKRYPDGEPGERNNWIGWQGKYFGAHPDLGLEPAPAFHPDLPALPRHVPKDEADYAGHRLARCRRFH